MKKTPTTKNVILPFIITYFLVSPFLYSKINAASPIEKVVFSETSPIQSTISGIVSDTNGQPVSGVTIQVGETNKGTITGFDGSYKIQAPFGSLLIFSAIGYQTESVPINDKTEINVILQESVTQLDEVVLNAGYYTVNEKKGTGNIAKIEAKTIEKQPVNNPLAAMQGHISGVNIVQNTGVPGGGYTIAIRGQNFIGGGTEPLYIIDGVPYGSQSLASVSVSASINGGNISPLNAINPNDIESIEVLKDADATAIYGARAANGVVLVTTKKGNIGITQFKANLSSTLGKISNYLDLMDTEQYLDLRREGIVNDGFGDYLNDPSFDFAWPDLKAWDQNRYTDWQKELIGGTAYRTNAQLSASGGSEDTQFLISGAYQKETTVFVGDSNYKKGSLHSNIDHSSKDQKFKINMSTLYTVENNRMPRTDLTLKAYTTEPNAPSLYDRDGQINWENNTWDNPLASLEEKYNVKINTLIANAGISYKLYSNVELKANLGYTDYSLASYRLLPSSARNPSFGLTPEAYSSHTSNSSKRHSWIIEPQLHWNKHWDRLSVSVLTGSTFQQQTTNTFVEKGTGFPNNKLLMNLSAAANLEIIEDTEINYNYQAFFGRINLDLDDIYILNLTGRRDGSSRFGPEKQFGNFGAVGAAWLFSSENFLKDSSFFNYGKIRGSYGTTGSDNIGDYEFLNTYSVSGFDYNGITTLSPTRIFNPDFGWEVNKKLEFALELGFLRDRIQLNTVWFQNRSSNQLIGIPLATTTGFNSLTGNFNATVENTGFEVDFRATLIQRNNFRWTTNFNITLPKNRLLEFPGLETSTFANRYRIGQPLTVVRLYHALGVDPETGVYQFEDYNKDGVINNLEDRQWTEDLAPKYFGGLGNTLSYKNLNLDVFLQFKNQKAFNYLSQQATPGYRKNAPVTLVNRWQQPGDDQPVQIASGGLGGGIDTGQLQGNSNAAVSDASFIRLRNIALTYKIPQISSKAPDVSIYLQGQNLFTITEYDGPDPEQSSYLILPPLRQLTLGLQLGF